MSYSRWLTSKWYVFWHAGFRKNDPHLACWFAGDERIPVLSLTEVLAGIADNWKTMYPMATFEERCELTRYAKEWIDEPEVSRDRLYQIGGFDEEPV